MREFPLHDPYDPRPDAVPTITQESFFRENLNVYIHLSTDYPDYVGILHKHTFIEIVYVISGKGVHWVGEHSAPVRKGDLFIINYDTPHAFCCEDSPDDPFVAYDLMFTPEFLDSAMIDNSTFESLGASYLFYSLFPDETGFGPDLHLSGSNYYTFGDVFQKIYTEYQAKDKGYLNLIRAYTVELIIKIMRKLAASHRDVPARHQQIVASALAYLRDNFNENISVEDLAAKVFLSKDYFNRLFRSVTGMPVNSFLQRLRIDEVCELLTTTDRKIGDISEECGFHDIKFFYSTFRKITGMTPGEYRNQNIACRHEFEDTVP